MKQQTLFFYDLETSGINPRQSRIMQFAGQRTSLDLEPIGEPENILIKLSDDVLPEPDAILITRITPQKTIAEGVTEADFVAIFDQQIATPGTVFVGFNNLRFDDEFIRFINYRNYYDPYAWQWQDDRSRWDILDLVRMTRALRPEGIEWPFASDGRPTNRLEYLTSVNKLNHKNAHDALADVMATIEVARLIKAKQPDLFNYLFQLKQKRDVKELINKQQPLVYTSGRYPSTDHHTTIVYPIAIHPDQDSAIMYDLRYDPTPFLNMSAQELASIWRFTKDPDEVSLPVKTLKYNRCPALAPTGVIRDKSSQNRINLTIEQAEQNLGRLKKHQADFAAKLLGAAASLDRERLKQQISIVDNQFTVDQRLYDGFTSDRDRAILPVVRQAKPADIVSTADKFSDERLKSLALLYKARNFPSTLTTHEAAQWDNFRQYKLFNDAENSHAARFFRRIEELKKVEKSKQKIFLLEELRLYGESILPSN